MNSYEGPIKEKSLREDLLSEIALINEEILKTSESQRKVPFIVFEDVDSSDTDSEFQKEMW